MTDIAGTLAAFPPLLWASRLIVWGAAGYLFLFGVLSFIRPAIIHRFFDSFVSSKGANFFEAAIRIVIGLAFMGVSAETKLPLVFFCFGAVLVATSIPMMFLYEFHKKQATWAIPFAKRILPLMGACALALSAVIVWALI